MNAHVHRFAVSSGFIVAFFNAALNRERGPEQREVSPMAELRKNEEQLMTFN
jgi:hypothetical protein